MTLKDFFSDTLQVLKHNDVFDAHRCQMFPMSPKNNGVLKAFYEWSYKSFYKTYLENLENLVHLIDTLKTLYIEFHPQMLRTFPIYVYCDRKGV